MDDIAQRILELFEDEPRTTSQIAETLQYPPPRVHEVVGELVQRGLIEHDHVTGVRGDDMSGAVGWGRLSDAGRDELNRLRAGG